VYLLLLHARTHLKQKKKKKVVCTCSQSCCRNEEVVTLHAPAVIGSIHRELEKVKFPEFLGAPDGAAAEAWLENMAMCFALHDYTSNMKVHMAVFQLKGSALLWWKTLLPQLNMAVGDVSWELFEERFRERYLSEEFIELNEFNAL
jgi:hypothetical protein